MEIYEVPQCPKCKENIDFSKARLDFESLVGPCPKCKEEFVVKPVAMCDQDFCKQKATHLSRPMGDFLLRCDMHAPYDKETCPHCEAKLTYTGPYPDKDGNTPILITRQDTIKLVGDRIILTCPSCKKDFPIRTNVRCQDCSAPATTFKWVLATPVELIAVSESVLRINCNEHAKNCFIATACYGTPDHYIVCQLSQFRDEYLLNTNAGRFFVKGYENWSPPLARLISRSGVLKLLTRLILRPITFVIGMIWGSQSEDAL